MNSTRIAKTCLLALSLASCGSKNVASTKPNVILVCLDTVRADHLGCYGYDKRDTTPFLDRLATVSTRFTNVSATACWTKPSVPSILTGLLPMQHGVYRGSAQSEAGVFTDILPQEALTLAEVFKKHGYQTAAFVKNSQLRRGIGFEQGFDLYRDKAGDAREIRWRASDWLDQRNSKQPFFLYLHLLDAHWPYAVPDQYASRWSNSEQVNRIRSGDWRAFRDAVNRGERTMSAEEKEGLIALYDGSLCYMDDQLEQLWSKLVRQGEDQNTILCVISDHGEEFLEHGRMGHGHGLYENLLSVPWILHRPNQAQAEITTRVSLLDLFPTLLAAAGIGDAMPGLVGVDRILSANRESPIIAEHLDPQRYHLSWTQENNKTLDIVVPLPFPSMGEKSISELQLSGRWEATLKTNAEGLLLARRLRPAKEQDAELIEIELKGQVSELTSSGFLIAGIPVSTKLYPEVYGYFDEALGEEISIVEEQMVKVRGRFQDGQMIARKIKTYGPLTEVETEIRGQIAVLADTHIKIGSVAITLNPSTSLEFRNVQNDLGAADVASLLLGEISWDERITSKFELITDAEEFNPLEAQEGPLTKESQIEHIRRFLEQRVWQVELRQSLSEEALDDLRAIGY